MPSTRGARRHAQVRLPLPPPEQHVWCAQGVKETQRTPRKPAGVVKPPVPEGPHSPEKGRVMDAQCVLERTPAAGKGPAGPPPSPRGPRGSWRGSLWPEAASPGRLGGGDAEARRAGSPGLLLVRETSPSARLTLHPPVTKVAPRALLVPPPSVLRSASDIEVEV